MERPVGGGILVSGYHDDGHLPGLPGLFDRILVGVRRRLHHRDLYSVRTRCVEEEQAREQRRQEREEEPRACSSLHLIHLPGGGRWSKGGARVPVSRSTAASLREETGGIRSGKSNRIHPASWHAGIAAATREKSTCFYIPVMRHGPETRAALGN